MKTRILLSSLAVALAGLGSTAFADSPQLQTQLALARAQKAQAAINCPPTPACPVPCTIPERSKAQAKSGDCPPCPVCPGVTKASRAAKLSKCPPSPACPKC